MYLSTPYKRWKTDAGYSLQAQRPGAVDGPYALTVKVTAKWSGDLDNAIKGTSDLLQEHGVIKNDKLAQRIVIERSASVDGMFVMVVATKSVEA
jgi:Holliday junction resolvase RusA-like endonuclease